MKKLFICFLVFPVILHAQVNESDSLNFKASLSITGFWQEGNVDTWIFRAKSDVSFKPWTKGVFRTKNSFVYQEFGKQKADEDFLSLNFLYFNPDRRLYTQLLGFFSTNFRREIEARYLLGAGVTYQILTDKHHWLKATISCEYEQTDFAKSNFNRTEYNGNNAINTFRATIWANGKYYVFNNKLIISHESYFQPSLEQSNNYRWQADLGIELPITKALNFKVNYLQTFESVVIENQKQEDRFLTFGFTVKNF